MGMAGQIIGLQAPVIYHLSRVIFGLLYGFLVYRLFLRLLNASKIAIIATVLAFSSTPLGWYRLINRSWVYEGLNLFNFSVNTPERITDRPHYIFGSILFLSVLFFMTQTDSQKRRPLWVVATLCSFLVGIVHTVSGILLLAITSLPLMAMGIQKRDRALRSPLFVRYSVITVGSLLGLGVVYWSVKQYTLVPEIWLDSFAYGQDVTLVSMLKYVLSFGPVTWVSVVGYILLLRKRQVKSELDGIMTLWFFIQYGLFLLGYTWMHADRVRFVQTLYYIPTAYGAVLFWKYAAERYGKRLFAVGVASLFLLSIPTYIHDLDSSIHTYTNYREFSMFVYPSVKQSEAFHFLDRFTPKESIVLAQYEVANLLLLYSHNQVIGNDQGWSKAQGETMLEEREAFFTATMDEVRAREYLVRHNVSYVYDGYQERFSADISRYTFLRSVFTNAEVTIFQVSPLEEKVSDGHRKANTR